MRTLACSLLALAASPLAAGCADPAPTDPADDAAPVALEPFAKAWQGASATAVATGPDGDLLIGGTFREHVDFGGGFHVPDAGTAVFAAHLDADGEHLWSGSTGSNDSLAATAVGPGGELYVGGAYDGAINFGTGKLTGYDNGYLAAFDPGGAPAWSRAIGGDAQDFIDDVDVLPDGTVVIAARAGDDADFGDGLSSPEYITKRTVVAAYTPEGELRWKQSFDGGQGTGLVSLAHDALGSIIVVGNTWSPIQVGGLEAPFGGFVLRLSPDGVPVWLRSTGEEQSDNSHLMWRAAVGPDGDVYVFGSSYYWGFSLDGVEVPTTDEGLSFVLHLSAEGKAVGAWTFDLPAYEAYSQALAVAPDGDVLVGFSTYRSLDLGGGLLGAGGSQNILLGRYTPEGALVRSMELEGTTDLFGDQNEQLGGLVVDAAGHAVVVGRFDGDLVIGGEELTSGVAEAMFVARLDF